MKISEKTCRISALAVIHETASDLSNAGVMDKHTMRRFDELCLISDGEITPAQKSTLGRNQKGA